VDREDLSFPSGWTEHLSTIGAAVMVHQFGIPASHAEEASESPVPIVEDVTTVLGSALCGHSVGGVGVLSVASTGATKMICSGEGGFVCASDDVIAAARARVDGTFGVDGATNARMPEVSAALGVTQLERLEQFVLRRHDIAAHYSAVLSRVGLAPLSAAQAGTGTWWRYLFRAPSPLTAREIVARAREFGVAFARPVLESDLPRSGRFPNAAGLVESVVSVPIYPGLSDTEIERVTEALRRTM
jgi:dTDP-4-amino-4,6-dideoxygalactose transaminase